jgi:DNA mismatch endonuclease, patch repair protein
MTDVLTPEQRKYNMSRIKAKDTKPELFIRKSLHNLGLRYRLQVKDLPGKPDLAFPKYQVALFTHGCFWHGHNCPLFKLPATQQEFWQAKIAANQARDSNAITRLNDMGWRVIVVWECALRGKNKLDTNILLPSIENIIRNGEAQLLEFRGTSQSF